MRFNEAGGYLVIFALIYAHFVCEVALGIVKKKKPCIGMFPCKASVNPTNPIFQLSIRPPGLKSAFLAYSHAVEGTPYEYQRHNEEEATDKRCYVLEFLGYRNFHC